MPLNSSRPLGEQRRCVALFAVRAHGLAFRVWPTLLVAACRMWAFRIIEMIIGLQIRLLFSIPALLASKLGSG